MMHICFWKANTNNYLPLNYVANYIDFIYETVSFYEMTKSIFHKQVIWDFHDLNAKVRQPLCLYIPVKIN